MEATTTATDLADLPAISFETSPESYRHLKLEVEGPIAWIKLAVEEEGGLRGLALHMQRTAVQGYKPLLERIAETGYRA